MTKLTVLVFKIDKKMMNLTVLLTKFERKYNEFDCFIA